MTAKQLIESLQNLGEENLDKEIVIFDGSSSSTPYKVEILHGNNWGRLKGKILID